MASRRITTQQGHLVRSTRWAGLSTGDAVAVDADRGRRRAWVFVAHVVNSRTGEEWVEVRGGRPGEAKGRAFRPEQIFPVSAQRGGHLEGLSLAEAPQLPF
ncbi:MAG: hypothetical protein HKL87_07535 [Acidimicrobiaceae bacterium]|nr:hypothetical protein [Acidimicrobiaceae bacterium]